MSKDEMIAAKIAVWSALRETYAKALDFEIQWRELSPDERLELAALVGYEIPQN